jgi:Hg(II)-responsive transcriptional regulator
MKREKEMKQTYTIGKLANAAAVNVETIRFYERKGMIAQPNGDNGIRQYNDEHLKRIRFTKRAQELGFTLSEIKELLELRISKIAKCGQIKNKTEQKLEDIRLKIIDLKKMERALLRLSESCQSKEKSIVECPILEELEFGELI